MKSYEPQSLGRLAAKLSTTSAPRERGAASTAQLPDIREQLDLELAAGLG